MVIDIRLIGKAYVWIVQDGFYILDKGTEKTYTKAMSRANAALKKCKDSNEAQGIC